MSTKLVASCQAPFVSTGQQGKGRGVAISFLILLEATRWWGGMHIFDIRGTGSGTELQIVIGQLGWLVCSEIICEGKDDFDIPNRWGSFLRRELLKRGSSESNGYARCYFSVTSEGTLMKLIFKLGKRYNLF